MFKLIGRSVKEDRQWCLRPRPSDTPLADLPLPVERGRFPVVLESKSDTAFGSTDLPLRLEPDLLEPDLLGPAPHVPVLMTLAPALAPPELLPLLGFLSTLKLRPRRVVLGVKPNSSARSRAGVERVGVFWPAYDELSTLILKFP